jgi:hypothetical protein
MRQRTEDDMRHLADMTGAPLSSRSRAAGRPGNSAGLSLACALFLIVLIVEALVIVFAKPGLAELGLQHVT